MYRLMIIDDEYMIHLSLRKLVETSGLDIIVTGEAEDGEEALELLDGSCPDIVVTDIRMPRMDGLAFIGAAQQRRNGIRFIILSGYDHFEYAQQAIRYGVSNFLLKPVDPDQFLESLSIVYEQLKKGRRALDSAERLAGKIPGAGERAGLGDLEHGSNGGDGGDLESLRAL
ncbi:response regulator [Paenibacillus sp. DMB20]|uniref:response regulator n=1 Tax=Paenibacillus sp. DMB20 TaxID=1642570 RepID=UPI000ABADB10|nr:response regulator [Paenibacillus sp. DMB20]